MSTITKERVANLLQFNSEGSDCHANAEQWEVHELARIALASLEAEPVCVIDQFNLDYLKSGSDADVWPASRTEMGDVLLYRSAPPAQVSVPDERYQQLSELYHAQEKRLFKLAQRIKGQSFDKYAHSPSQAIDVLESAIFGEREEDFRAAMLQGAEPVTTDYKLPEGWVACSERMPEIGIKALCFPVNDEPIHATYNGQVWLQDISWSTSDEPIDNVISCNVFHWMPLPAAPQQE